jgi:hypothetical protein
MSFRHRPVHVPTSPHIPHQRCAAPDLRTSPHPGLTTPSGAVAGMSGQSLARWLTGLQVGAGAGLVLLGFQAAGVFARDDRVLSPGYAILAAAAVGVVEFCGLALCLGVRMAGSTSASARDAS